MLCSSILYCDTVYHIWCWGYKSNSNYSLFVQLQNLLKIDQQTGFNKVYVVVIS